MKDFETWYSTLIRDELWYSLLRAYKDETIRKAGEKVYAGLVADGSFSYRPMSENRKHVYNIVCKNPGDKVNGKPWHELALEEKIKKDIAKEEWKPVSWDKRAEYLKQVQAEIDKIADNKIRPLFNGEAEAKGQYDLPKPKATGAPSASVEVIVEHINKVNTARRLYYLERNPDASEEEIQAYLKKFDIL